MGLDSQGTCNKEASLSSSDLATAVVDECDVNAVETEAKSTELSIIQFCRRVIGRNALGI